MLSAPVASGGPKEKKVSLLLPEFFVAGSARASVSVLGQLRTFSSPDPRQTGLARL